MSAATAAAKTNPLLTTLRLIKRRYVGVFLPDEHGRGLPYQMLLSLSDFARTADGSYRNIVLRGKVNLNFRASAMNLPFFPNEERLPIKNTCNVLPRQDTDADD